MPQKQATADKAVAKDNEMVARRVQVVELTPEKAAELLGHNYSANRKLNKRKVAEYVKLIESGKWNPYLGDMVRVAKDGTLIDGQHRCQAVIASGKPIEVLYCDGFEIADYGYVDAGTARRGADAIQGMKYANNAAAFIKCCANVEMHGLTADGLNAKEPIPNSEYPEWLERLGKDFVLEHVALGTNMSVKLHGPTTAYALFSAITAAADPDMHDQFFEDLASPLVVSYTIATFKSKAMKLFESRVRTNPYDMFRYLCATWNAYMIGRELRMLKMPDRAVIDGLPADVDIIEFMTGGK